MRNPLTPAAAAALPEPTRLRELMADPDARAAAGRALRELAAMVRALTPGALLAQAACEADPMGALRALTAGLASERAAIEDQRERVRLLLEEDAGERFGFDVVAASELVEAETAAVRADTEAKLAQKEAERLSLTLATAGLSAEEVEAVARLRQPPNGLPDDLTPRLRSLGLSDAELQALEAARAANRPEVHAVVKHRSAAAAARQRAAALGAFLRDPKRDLAALPEDLAATLRARAEGARLLALHGPGKVAAD